MLERNGMEPVLGASLDSAVGAIVVDEPALH